MDTVALPQPPPAGDAFALSRRPDDRAVVLLIFFGFLAIGVACNAPRPLPAIPAVVVLGLLFILILVRLVCPSPTAVTLSASGLQVQWPDHVADHPWDTLSWAGGSPGVVEILDNGRRTGFNLGQLISTERRRFAPMFLNYLDVHSAVEPPAVQLLGGPALSAPPAVLRLHLGVAGLGLATAAYGAVAMWVHRLISSLPDGNFLPIWGAIFVGWGAYGWWRERRRSVCFTEEGLLEYKGAARMPLMRYEVIEWIIVRAEGSEPVLSVQSGRWAIKVYPLRGDTTGARRLLRKRAVNAYWDMW